MKTRKQLFQERIKKLVAHKNDPMAPVDASTLLLAEASRIAQYNSRIVRKMAWAYRLAAYRLETMSESCPIQRYWKEGS